MKLVKILVCICGVFGMIPAYGKIRLPQLVADGMVLQRNTSVNIWGWADADEKVTIRFQNRVYTIVTGKDSVWKVALPPMKVGGPYVMDLTARNHIILHDILVGDVWFCSGQSNMVLPMERVKEKYPNEIVTANYPMIRNFFVPTAADVNRLQQDLPGGKWIKADVKGILSFGASSWFFAKVLYQKYHVPIGIINASVGGTPIEAWISREGLKGIEPFDKRIAQFGEPAFMDSVNRKHSPPVDPFNTTVYGMDKGLSEIRPWFDTAYVPHHWHHFWLPGYWDDQGIKDLHGVVWFRKEIDFPASVSWKPAKLFLGRIVDADQTYVNGRLVGSISYQYPPRRYTVSAGTLKPGKNIIVVRVINFAGKGGFVPDKSYRLEIGNDTIDLRGDWQYKVGEAFEPAETVNTFSAQNEPGGLFNTMVAPVTPYTIKGIVWYQGESNTSRAAAYGKLLKALIVDWRKSWNAGNIPFIFAQLPNFNEVRYLPTESEWAQLREGQLHALSLPKTGMAVTLDAGEWNDIHPLDKKTVGNRLALAAEHVAYGETDVVPSGPIYKLAKIEGNKIELTFENVGGGLITNDGDELAQFAIAGADKKFVWAQATIEGDKVLVWNDKVPMPLYVRYAWADNPEGANLYNKEGLPASPFRTDKPQ
ncbi:sialate O-acetylesterase [Mucilaginibacter dorajii]|uniref:Sialate O-acetylesterase n=1 Tax=Mucilaginibacter dorajii TaxID=692994 RepID=A0ABP7QIV6_9SPHI|nr:sialate O-acetylesterase [Mucilaginibacter dorajii]MCS3734203.1 sialate O-acetylesterase [Mucilaginibacter dorajii]